MRVVWVAAALVVGSMVSGCFDPDQALYRSLLREDTWDAGEHELHGVVKTVEVVQTDAGPQQRIHLKGATYEDRDCDGFLVPADPALEAGDRVELTLQFEQRTFNGRPAVWSPQMPCPGPGLVSAIAKVLVAVAQVSGAAFLPVAAVPGGVEYEYVPGEDEPMPLDGLSVRLLAWDPPANMPMDGPRQWSEAATQLFVEASEASKVPDSVVAHRVVPAEFPVLEALALDGGSPTTHLAFTDLGRAGQLDLGDRLRVTGLQDGFYALQIDPCIRRCGVPFQGLVQAAGMSLDVLEPAVTVAHQEGADGQAEVLVVATRGPALDLQDVRWRLRDDDAHIDGAIGALQATGGPGSFEVVDGAQRGVLDAGDRIRVQAAHDLAGMELMAWDESRNRYVLGHEWVAGAGRPPLDLLWSVAWSGDEGVVTASGPSELRELADFRFGWLDDGEVLADGATDGCTGDRVLTFHDSDEDGHLSTGDRVSATGTQENACSLVLTGFHGHLRSQVDFPDPTPPSAGSMSVGGVQGFPDFRGRADA